MPPLKNTRHERFAQELANGTPVSTAMRLAGAEVIKVQSARRFYVYVLVDDADGRAFYVGKGTGARVLQHMREAYSDHPINPRKAARIIAANQRGQFRFYILFDSMSERDALTLERALIVRGKQWLTNIMSGTRTRAQVVQDEIHTSLSQVMPLCHVVKRNPQMLSMWAGLVSEFAEAYDLCQKQEVR